MTPVLVLAGIVVGLGLLGPWLLRRVVGSATRTSPRAGLVVWVGAVATWLVGLLALGPAAALTFTGSLGDGVVGQACTRCVGRLRDAYGASVVAEVPPAWGFLVGAGLAGWTGLVAVRHVRMVRGARRRHLGVLSAVARRENVGGIEVRVLPGSIPAAYCLPGAAGAIVVSSAALAGLRPGELSAVVAHESAHLRERHHLLRGFTEVVATAFAAVPLARAARAEVARLVEMSADDHACRAHARADLAGALAVMATAGPTGRTGPGEVEAAGTLAVSGGCPAGRVLRLVDPPPRRSGARWAAVVAASVVAGGTGGVLVAVLAPALRFVIDGAC